MLMIPPTSNTPKGRSDLKSRFKNKTKLSAAHFHELIDSSLNKPDERFYGVWKEKCIYPKGAVVYEDDSGFLWQAKQDICQEPKPPSQDLENWKLSPNQLYGIWNKKFAYANGAVVYDKASGLFWQAKQDICQEPKPPSQDLENWGLSPDQLYGIWNEKFAYANGAVVYDKASGFFWQAKRKELIQWLIILKGPEILGIWLLLGMILQKWYAKPPSQDLENWQSPTYQLHCQHQRDIQTLQEELTQMKHQLVLLKVGLVGIIFWWLVGGISHLVAGRM